MNFLVIPETRYKPKDKIIEKVPFTKGLGIGQKEHVKNFVAAAKAGDRNTHANVGIGVNVAKVAHMGNIAYRVGEKRHWDDEKQTFSNDRANALIKPAYRAP